MQTLSIWPSKSNFWVVPQLELEVDGSSCNLSPRRRRRKRCDLGDSVCYSRKSSPFLVWACRRSPKFDLDYGVFSKFSKPRVYLLSELKKGSLSASFALAWALEGQAVGSDVSEKDSNSLDGFSGEVESEDVDLNDVKSRELNDNNDKKEEDSKTEEVGGEKGRRVDVIALARSLWFAKTADDVEEVLKDRSELPLQVCSSMIRGFGKDKKLHSAMALVEWLKRKKRDTNGLIGPNLYIYNSLLGAVKQSEKFDEAEKIIEDMIIEGVLPNVVTYNSLMGIYLEQGREVEALDLFEEIQKNGLTPSPASYSTTLLAYRRLEDGFGALNFYIELKQKYQKGDIGKDADEDWPNEMAKLENFTVRICYQVIRRWLVKDENLSTNVLKLLTEMDKAGLKTGRSEHERLVWACTREEHYTVVRELYSRMRERDSGISLSVCNHVIWLMGKAKKWWAALEVYEDLLDKGPKPNNMSYELIVSHFNILLTAAKKRGIWRWGVRLLNKMEEKGLKPGSREWNAVLVACSKASETSAAVQIFRRMVEQGEKPTIISYGALLSALEKGKLYDDALQVWEHMIRMGVEPNLYAYTILASIYAAQGKFNMVDSIIRDMVSSGVEPTVVTFNAIISGCARNNMGTAAYEWFHQMKAHGILPNEITYEMLTGALAKDGKPRIAYELYLRAYNEGMNLSSKAYDAVTQSSQDYGATIDLSALGPRPPEKKKVVRIRKNLSEFCNLADVPRRSKPFDKNELYTQQTERKLF
ncbi:protein LOW PHOTOSYNTHETIC EFFICIENCY 1, chloroplastic-like [Cornus florida]|uniref:protein LOW PHOTOSYNTHETIC EFFICIENCY 1, chloroplastic-like n=1 Tax=Cornus florida TaxID=4283 RepID=UPI0028982814|nr:protein LOW PHOTOSYNTHETIC EFFICIENCY 1, chloroplastic-like [Cornus florida]